MLLCLLGLFCVRSYEAMVYLGPLARRRHRLVDAQGQATRGSGRWPAIAALAFAAAAVVAAATIVDYWNHPHFMKVRAMTFDFWQNLQFVIPLVGLAISAAVALAAAVVAAGQRPAAGHRHRRRRCSRSTPWYRLVYEHSILYPPAHYLARQAAGVLLAVLLGCMWLHVAWQRRPPRGPRHRCACRRSSRRLVAGHDGAARSPPPCPTWC